jgi:hypothetical protein
MPRAGGGGGPVHERVALRDAVRERRRDDVAEGAVRLGGGRVAQVVHERRERVVVAPKLWARRGLRGRDYNKVTVGGGRTLPCTIASSSASTARCALSRSRKGSASYASELCRKSTVCSRARFASDSGVVDAK